MPGELRPGIYADDVKSDVLIPWTDAEQIIAVAGKGAAVISPLSRLMVNIGGPTFTRRCFLMSPTQSLLLCGYG